MSTLVTRVTDAVARHDVPPLFAGDRLTQREFHRRYEAYPCDVHFQLIGGIVYMMTPAGFDHGDYQHSVSWLLGQYELATPGVAGAVGPTVKLSPDCEPEPDAVLFIRREYGGRVRLTGRKTKYVTGPPELIIEVSHSTEAIDLHGKRIDYERAGVLEYIVVNVGQRRVHWFDFASGQELSVDKEGVLRSRAFPGLWIDVPALFRGDKSRLAATLQRGTDSDEHAEFVKVLKQKQAAVRRRK